MQTETNITTQPETRQPTRHETPVGVILQYPAVITGKIGPWGTFEEAGTDNPIWFSHDQNGLKTIVTFDLAPSRVDNIGEGPVTIEVEIEDTEDDNRVHGVYMRLQFDADGNADQGHKRLRVEETSVLHERFEAAALAIHTLLRNDYEVAEALREKREAEIEAEEADLLDEVAMYGRVPQGVVL